MSLQKSDEQYDQSLILFCLAVSHLVVVNVEGEISEPVKKYFLLCIQALKYLGETRVTQPTVHFVLNKRKNANVDYCQSLLDYVQQAVKETNLDKEINLKKDNVHSLPIAIDSGLLPIGGGKNDGLSTAGALLDKVQNLCQSLFQASSQIINETGDSFCIPTNWVSFAYRVLQTIKKHPSLTYFQDVFERNQYKDIREDMRKDFDRYLPPVLAAQLIDREKQSDSDRIKDSFKKEYDKILKILEENHRQHCDKHEATGNIRERSLGFLKTQLNGILRSWEFSALLKSKQHANELKINAIERMLREKAMHITHKNHLMNREAAKTMFDEVFKQFMDDVFSNDFQIDLQWKQCIELVHHLYDIFDIDALPSVDHLYGQLNFLVTLDQKKDHRLSIPGCLSRICTESVSRCSEVTPLIAHASSATQTVSIKDVQQSYKFLDNAEMLRHFNKLLETKLSTRQEAKKSIRQQFPRILEQNWKSIIKVRACFEALTVEIQKSFHSHDRNEAWNEIKFMQNILGAVNDVIRDLSKELNIFGFSLSKELSSSLSIYAFLAATLHYYNQQKNHFLDLIDGVKQKKSKLVDKYIPWVIIVDNDDENVATNVINDLSEVVLRHSFCSQMQETIDKNIDEQKQLFYRSSIIKRIDDQVYQASDEWLMNYILEPQQLIAQHFETQWLEVRRNLEKDLQKMKTQTSLVLLEVFHLFEEMYTELQKQDGHALSFIDQLFLLKGDENKARTFDKKLCAAQLFYGYLLGQPIPAEVSTQHGTIYSVDSRWKRLIDNVPKPSGEAKKIFRLMQSKFETATITYLGLFLEKLIKEKIQIERAITSGMDSSVETHFLTVHNSFVKQMEECGKRCPACKRICDVDHHLDKASPVGRDNNRHRCQSGHQIRAMGGIRYESSNEASLMWCGLIRDDDVVITSNDGSRQTWKTFKEAHSDWDFGDGKSSEDFETRYLPIWKKIGRKLCAHFVQNEIVGEMRYVEKNSPSPINHFILLLDHSGSMNERTHSHQQFTPSPGQTAQNSAKTATNPSNLTAWENLLAGVREFLAIRDRQLSKSDRITVIVFANRVENIYHREQLARVNVERLNIPMTQCGEGTKYCPAFEMVVKTLEETNSEPERNLYRQTVIFMTDGEPQDDAAAQLQKMRDWREGSYEKVLFEPRS